MKNSKCLKLLAGLALMSASTVWAQIATYDFAVDTSATAVDENVAAGNFDPDDKFGTAGGRSGSGMMFARSYATGADLDAAITGEGYFSFTVGPDGGHEMNLSSLAFDFGYTSTASNQIGSTLNAYVLTSIDGFTAANVLGSQSNVVTEVTPTATYTNVIVDLSGEQFQSIETATEFRIYLSDDVSDNDVIHRIDNVVLDGLVVTNDSVVETSANVNPTELAIELNAPAVMATGSVDFVYSCATNMDISIAVSGESNPGSLKLLSASSQTLGPTGGDAVVLEFEFDNTVAGLETGSATGLVTINWSETGGGTNGVIEVPISGTYFAPTLAVYNFNSGLGVSSSDANVTAESFTLGSGITNGAGHSQGSASLYARASVTHPANQLSIVNAIADNDYFSVIIGPDAGSMNLTSFEFDYGYTRSGPYDGKQFKAYLLTSIDGFVDATSIVGSETIDIGPNTSTATYPNGTTTIDLSGLAQFQGITTNTEFRIYIADNTGGAEYIHRIDNMVLRGTIALSGGTPVEITTFEMLEDGDMAISWDTVFAQNYNVLTNENLSLPVWGIYDTVVGDGGTVTITDTPDQDKVFYKVETAD